MLDISILPKKKQAKSSIKIHNIIDKELFLPFHRQSHTIQQLQRKQTEEYTFQIYDSVKIDKKELSTEALMHVSTYGRPF